jgi:two-component system cell cycle response regulator DivK
MGHADCSGCTTLPIVSGYPHPPRRSGVTLLIVDDEIDNREMLSLYFELCGYRIQSAANGEEAIALTSLKLPDLILMDLMMPRMDGWEATRLLKANVRTRNIPVIALSAGSQGDEHDVARRAGCDAFIAKPCDLDDLAATLNHFL